MTAEDRGAKMENIKAEEEAPARGNRFNYIQGWRLYTVALGLSLVLFLVNFEVTIVSAALVSITNDLQDFGKSSWIVTGYLTTYIGGLVIWAKISDLLGRKRILLAALLVFTAFSAGCGGAQTMTQLIVFRTLQGLGGSGIFSIAMIMLYELVPPEKYPKYTSVVMVMYALSLVLGPIVGGAISLETTWRWVFLLNVPAGVLLGVLLYLAIPRGFPYQGLDRPGTKLHLAAIDFPGALLLLATLMLLITGFQQAAALLSWRSGSSLGPICASALACVLFLASQWHASRPGSTRDPVLPWRFFKNRVMMGLFLNAFTTGAVGVTCIILIPIRYQTVVQSDSLQAALRLIPFTAAGPTGTVIVAGLAKGRRVAPLYLTIGAELLQLIGLVFISRGSDDPINWTALWGLEVIVALGMGGCMGTLTLLTPAITGGEDLALGTAAFNQFRILGGAVIVSIATAVGNNWVKARLLSFLTGAQIEAIFASTASIEHLSPDLQRRTRDTFAESFNLQMRIVLGVALAAVFASMLMWRKPQIKIP